MLRLVSNAYGLEPESCITINDVANRFPHIIVPQCRSELQRRVFAEQHFHQESVTRALKWPWKFKAVLIYEEPDNYQSAIQIITDIVNGRDGDAFEQNFSQSSDRTNPQMPVLLANPDLTYGR